MKKAVILTVILVLTLWLTVPVSAGTGGRGGIYPSEEMDGLFDSLPEEVKVELEDFLAAENDGDRLSAVRDKLDVFYWIMYVLDAVKNALLPGFTSCAPLLCIIAVSALLRRYLSEGTLSDVGKFTVAVITGVTVCGVTVTYVNTAAVFISRISAVMTAMLPVMNAILITSGELTSAGVGSAGLMLYVTATEKLMDAVFVPLAGVLLSLCSVTGVFRGVNISSLVTGIRKVVMTLMGFSLLIYSFVMGIQSTLAQSADSLSMKTARFAIGTYVPIVGGALSDALVTVTAGLSVIKRFAGSLGIIIILLTVLPAVISLFIGRLSLLMCKTVAEAVECDSAAVIIGDAESVLSLFLAFAVLTGMFFIFATVLFMNTGVGMY